MFPDLSDRERAAFAEIVDSVSDPERVQLRRQAVVAGLAVSGAAPIVLRFMIGWPWAAVVAFVLTFALALAAGVAVAVRRLWADPR